MILDILAMLLLAGGAFFLLVSTVGLLRLPDFFTRAHAVGKSETLGSLLLLGGLAIEAPGVGLGLKLFLVVLFVAVTNPTGIHVLTRAALRSGMEIWVQPEDRGRPPEREVRAGAHPTGGGDGPIHEAHGDRPTSEARADHTPQGDAR